ncbi:right-handed parallel beta-helix repeat-containing protein [Histidinibacterium lentulum]|uniref:Right-handed parallel beta-helix repeat-containing protein n=1 Tax=Histidinibacterium lentulum TaxID=2480588 RepID=A0A3N2R820_9RHOB|nr:right-handed parallel beta-helix repeat-containing protein [Histidinibacterium lentulum]ROU03620.1 right-handed parallel beta-helix repeat-containing protein [Histidinibacterium lentulum]
MWRKARLLLTGLALGLLAGTAGAQETGRDLVAQWLFERDMALGEPPRVRVESERPPAGITPAGEAVVEAGDIRLALAQIGIGAGSDGRTAIAAAQPVFGPGAVYLRQGRTDLDGLVDAAAAAGLDGVLFREDGAVVARAPVVVLEGAALALGRGDRLTLAGEAGAFLLAFGALSIEGARVAATGSTEDDAFRPFVASLGTGTMRVSRSSFEGLGFGAAPLTAGVAHVAEGLFRPPEPPWIGGSRFADVHGVAAVGANGLTVTGNSFVKPRGSALRIAESSDVRVLRNLVTDAQGTHALRLSGPGAGVEVRDNVLVGGHHAALRIDDGLSDVVLGGNVVADFAGPGAILAEGTGCVAVDRNLFRGNGGDGLSAMATGSLLVEGNAILGNGGNGVVLTAPEEHGATVLAANRVSGNRAGLRATSLGRLRLAGNDLTGQLPRLMTGDLAQLVPFYLREGRDGAADIVVERVSARAAKTPPGAGFALADLPGCGPEEGA